MDGLMDYKARFYAPLLGRFTQPDSLIPDASNLQAWNRYSYVTNHSINFNDPTGYNEECGLGESGCRAGKYTPSPDQSGSRDRVLSSYGVETDDDFTRDEKF